MNRLQQLNEERRYLISARHIFQAAQKLEQAKAELAVAQRELDFRCRDLIDELGPMDVEALGLPLVLEHDGFRLEVADDWHEYGPSKKHEAVSVELIRSDDRKSLAVVLNRVDRDIAQAHRAVGIAQEVIREVVAASEKR